MNENKTKNMFEGNEKSPNHQFLGDYVSFQGEYILRLFKKHLFHAYCPHPLKYLPENIEN